MKLIVKLQELHTDSKATINQLLTIITIMFNKQNKTDRQTNYRRTHKTVARHLLQCNCEQQFHHKTMIIPTIKDSAIYTPQWQCPTNY